MKMLITMAGRGSRFQEVGVSKPKHEISVKQRPMFDWAMQSLTEFFDEEFIFITQSSHNPSDFLNDACERLGIRNFQTITLNEYTNGQAQTAFKTNSLLHPEDSVAIYNNDTYIEEGILSLEHINGDGYIPTFTASGTRWSFVRTDEEEKVVEVSEKNKISNIATAGFYYFDRWGDFVEAYEHSAQQVESKYGETYVAPLYNYLINQGRTVLQYQIDPDSIHVLGTPKDLKKFDPDFSVKQ